MKKYDPQVEEVEQKQSQSSFQKQNEEQNQKPNCDWGKTGKNIEECLGGSKLNLKRRFHKIKQNIESLSDHPKMPENQISFEINQIDLQELKESTIEMKQLTINFSPVSKRIHVKVKIGQ